MIIHSLNKHLLSVYGVALRIKVNKTKVLAFVGLLYWQGREKGGGEKAINNNSKEG